MTRPAWANWISEGPNFVRGPLIAVYQRTVRGHGLYHVYPVDLPPSRRTTATRLAEGGLPDDPLYAQLATATRPAAPG
jgi:hypothetical protein